jgi:uncharacterized protein YbcC (UPF0753/DUF2309 family)
MLDTRTHIEEPRALDRSEAGVPMPAADQLHHTVARVCRRIPPLWDLPNYVAVNPFLGFAEQPLPDAARTIADELGGQVLPSLAFYRARWAAGGFGLAELSAAARRAGHNPAALIAILEGRAPAPLRPADGPRSCAEQRGWADLAARHIALWCAVHASEGAGPGLYARWRANAPIDRSLEAAGLAGWRAWASELPATPLAAIATMLARLGLPADEHAGYLYRLLSGVYGWASFFRRASWQTGADDPGELADLLAICACVDGAIDQLAPQPRRPAHQHTEAQEDEATRVIFQEALEDGYSRRLLAALRPPPQQLAERPDAQAVFCIDVRSEPLRRHLEGEAPAIETRGFAGFFGVALEWQAAGGASARCPVLLTPSLRLRDPAPAAPGAQGLLKEIAAAPAAAFSFVETLGLAYGLRLAGDALGWWRAPRADEGRAPIVLDSDGANTGADLAARAELAASILKNTGLRAELARLVLLCGHASQSENNPHAAALDCGACGGHGGALNARIAAALLNDPAVRERLASQGFPIPDNTWFVAGLHDTATDTVSLLDREQIPASHAADAEQLERWLARAGELARAERAAALGLPSRPAGVLDRLLRRRAGDWSEVRPEWGLARNAAFIAARRARTRGVDLAGRAFLHEYDWASDPDSSILSLILSAPMVVASWINLQYLASTVDNRMFGSGTKALHNRVGSLGVVQGNGGDLRTGLPLQSVAGPDGRWYHEPLRLQVVVEAPRERIMAVVQAHPHARDLVEHGWVRLVALDPHRGAAARWVPGRGWEEAERPALTAAA